MKIINSILKSDIKIIIGNTGELIKVSYESEHFYYGFDILTEQIARIKKINGILMPDSVINLLRCEKSRVKFATMVTNKVASRTESAKILNMSTRNFHRLIIEHFPEYINEKHLRRLKIKK